MSNLPLEVVELLGQTIAKVVPVTIVLALVFSVLNHFWACNPGTPWWRKRELITDICYWFFVPVFARVLRRVDGTTALVTADDIEQADPDDRESFWRGYPGMIRTMRAGLAYADAGELAGVVAQFRAAEPISREEDL